MKTSVAIAMVLCALTAVPATGALQCRGVFDLEDGELHGRFRCRYHDEVLRRVRAVCRDGEPGCDADGACNAVCRFALCADATCADTVDVTVPLRRHGRAKGTASFNTGDARVRLRCLPSRGACGPGTTLPPTTSTTSTTLPDASCTGTIAGAVEGTFACSTSLSSGGLGLPVLRLRLSGPDVDGAAALLLVGRGSGERELGSGVILAVADLTRPDLPAFQAIPGLAGAHVELALDTASGPPHGTLEAVLPGADGGEALTLHAEF